MSIHNKPPHLSQEELRVTIGALIHQPPESIANYILLAVADGKPSVLTSLQSPEEIMIFTSSALARLAIELLDPEPGGRQS